MLHAYKLCIVVLADLHAQKFDVAVVLVTGGRVIVRRFLAVPALLTTLLIVSMSIT